MKMRMRVGSVIAAALVCAGVRGVGAGTAPDGLIVEFLQGASVARIADAAPEFGWSLHSDQPDDHQAAYRILVAKDLGTLARGEGDLWDSGRVESSESVNVEYAGKPLAARQSYCWKVRAWLRKGGELPWSEPQVFSMSDLQAPYATTVYPLQESVIAPVAISKLGEGHYLADFGRVAFGTLCLDIESPEEGRQIGIELGERGDAQGVNRKPGGSVVYRRFEHVLAKGTNNLAVFLRKGVRPAAKHNIGDILGNIGPFRYVEVTNCPVALAAPAVRQVAVHYPFNEKASSFASSDAGLNDIWELCKYTMKATSFLGVYIDGDRERLPYEADAYINQLSHYAVDREFTLARHTHEGFMKSPTWPTEWKQHSVLIAWADYLYTGNRESLAHTYSTLKSAKIYQDRARPDGLLDTKGLRDIVDWPGGERDGYEFKPVNTVVNAFNYRTLVLMAGIADALGKRDEASGFREKAAAVQAAFNKILFDGTRGVYVDGEGATHASLHANMMPLAFGLVPPERRKTVVDFVVSRGMACSVYGAQYLLEALYEAGRADVALERMTARDIRSWHRMLELGSTITLEAWDPRFKPNLDWNHAWGAAPGNIVSRYLLGVRPIEPGFAKALIQPQPASLARVRGTVPTIRGPIDVAVENEAGRPFKLTVDLPVNMTARVAVPRRDGTAKTVTVDGAEREAQAQDGFLFVDGIGSGTHVLVAR